MNWKALRDRFWDLLYPPRCPFCGRVLERPEICTQCRETLPWIAEETVARELHSGLVCASLLWYEGAVRDGIRHFKFQGGLSAARPMGALLAQCAADQFSGCFDVVTWAPVSRKRKRKRGYDQSELLAREACRVWEVSPERLLVKNIHTPAQSSLQEVEARQANVQGVYGPAPDAKIRDRRILIVDDVCTTGATLEECARVLREAGAAEVWGITLARPRPKKERRTDSGDISQEKWRKSL